MKKKIILLIIILIPSLIYFFFELSEVNFKKMAFYGPKNLAKNGDTIYYQIPNESLKIGEFYKDSIIVIEKNCIKEDEIFLIIFCGKNEANKLAGILELEKYKKEQLDKINLRIVQYIENLPKINESVFYITKLKNQLGIQNNSIKLNTINGSENNFEKIRNDYFLKKPLHVFNYFAVLVDKNNNIRGYYDPSFVSEVKRMIQEYQHLVLKDEHATMQENQRIENIQ